MILAWLYFVWLRCALAWWSLQLILTDFFLAAQDQMRQAESKLEQISKKPGIGYVVRVRKRVYLWFNILWSPPCDQHTRVKHRKEFWQYHYQMKAQTHTRAHVRVLIREFYDFFFYRIKGYGLLMATIFCNERAEIRFRWRIYCILPNTETLFSTFISVCMCIRVRECVFNEPNLPTNRQMAGVLTKNFINSHWDQNAKFD